MWAWLLSWFRTEAAIVSALATDIILKAGVNLTGVHPELLRRLNAAQEQLRLSGYGLRITSANDGTHAQRSLHYRGLAVDVTPADKAKGFDVRHRGVIIAALRRNGLNVLDEYNSPSARATAGHLHVSMEV